MRSAKRAIAVFTASSVIAGAGLMALAGPASAAPPPWSPDPQQVGRVILYNADGTVKTSGLLNQPLAAYAAADGAATLTGGSGAALNKIQLVAANPSSSQPTTAWPTDSGFTGSDSFPNATAPYPITGPGFTFPVNQIAQDGSEAVVSVTLGGFSPDSNPAYGNKLQLRLVNNGPKWFASTIQIDTVAGTWTLTDPDTVSTSTTLTASPASPQVAASLGAAGASTTFTATVKRSDTNAAMTTGQVQLTKNGVNFGAPVAVNASGVATFTDTPPNTQGAASTAYAAKYVAGPVAAAAAVFTGSTGNLPYAVNDPLPASSTSLSLSASTIPQYTNVTFTATVTGTPAATSGNVQFTINGSAAGLPLAPVNGSGVATLVTNAVPLGSNLVKATFLGNASLAGSASADVPLEVTAATCPGVGSVCSDPQTIQVKVNPGSLTITSPYTPANPFVLPDLTLNAAGDLLTSSAQFPKAGDPAIVVTSTLSGDPVWTVSAESTDLVGLVPANKINGQNVGLTAGTLVNYPGSGVAPSFTKGVTFTDQAAAAGVTVADPGSAGLKGGPKTFAKSNTGGNGTAWLQGTLTVNAPTTTVNDTYTGTVTFTVV